MSDQLAEQRQAPQLPNDSRSNAALSRASSLSLSLLAVVVLFFAAVWLMDLEQTLPHVRAPGDESTSEPLEGHAMMLPGFHDIDRVDAQTDGEWLIQEIGDRDWLATDQPANEFRAAFYGTELYLHARVGPEAGNAYVMIDGEPASGLPQDETGSYVDLWSNQAADTPISLARDLAHGEHVVELTSGSEGEVAISGFEVIAETPFPWAFVLAYTGIAAGMFAAVRHILLNLNRRPPQRDSDGVKGGTATDT